MIRARVALGATAIACAAAACDHSGTVVPPPGPFGFSPPVTSKVHLDHLSGPVDVVRDTHGMVHIWATSVSDALRVEGYQIARDRTVQLELVRRFAEGRTAELLGDAQPSLIDGDITMRTIGLARVAKQMYAAIPADSELKTWLDAYADGVSQLYARLQSGEEELPKAMIGIPKSAFTPWTGADSLAIGRLESWNLAYSADGEITQTKFVKAARTTFPNGPRARLLVDVVRFAPLDPTLSLENGFPNDTQHTMLWRAGAAVRTPDVRADLLASAQPFVDATRAVRDVFGRFGIRGSNDWIVGPSRTATGHAMLANDPHLAMSAPSVFWMVQLDAHDPNAADAAATDMHVAGTAFPGIPGLILGFNRDIAWGATTADYDVTDVYDEKLTPDGSAVVFGAQTVPLQKVHESIAVAGGAPLEYDVLVVPHHGPIVPTIVGHKVVPPDPAKGAMSVAWTGSKPTNELSAVAGVARAKTVEDFRTAMRNFAVGAQNWVVADTRGDIFYTTQSGIPLRDKRAFTWDPKTFTGTLPCFVEPGDGTAEWTGAFLDEAYVPHAKNPSKAYVGTANGDQVGDTLDNDPSNDIAPNGQPVYLGCWHDPGFRVGRIHQRIENLGHAMSLDDMAAIQSDARSALGAKLAPGILDAIEHAQAEATSAGSHPDLASIVKSTRFQGAPMAEMHELFAHWSDSDYDTPPGVSLDDGSLSSDAKEATASEATLVFNAWLMRMAQAVLGDELTEMNENPPPVDMRIVTTYLMTADRKSLATFDATAGDSALFDDLTTPGVVESRDERTMTSLLDALDFLAGKLGSDRTKWRWGRLHTLRFESLVPLWSVLSIPPVGDSTFPGGFPRHGDGYNVDVGQPDSMPIKLADATFTYAEGPTQRFVIDLDPSGPVPRNVLPGGEVWDNTSTHFRDEAEMWRRNQNHPMPYAHDDVAAAAEERIVYAP